MKKRKNMGFTLVEVLLTVLVIGALAGIAVLALGRSTEKTRERVCAVNRETIKAAWSVYKFSNPKTHGTLQGFINAGCYDQIANDRARCPSGGDYIVAADGRTINCTLHH